MGKHDNAYKLLFSFPHLIEQLIRGFVPGDWTRQLDFQRLDKTSETHPREKGGMRYNDVVWRLPWHGTDAWVYVYLMLEVQSTEDPFMAVRILDYVGGHYLQRSRQEEVRRARTLPIVLPVVLYRGVRTWTAETEVFDLIAPAPAEVTPYLPHMRYLLIDASAFPAEELAAMRNPVACLLWLEGSPRFDDRPIHELIEVLEASKQVDLAPACALWLSGTFLPSRLPGVTVEVVETLEEVSQMIAENAIDWTAEWKEEGRQEGRQEGKEQGRLEGRQEGEASLLLRLLKRRFGGLAASTEEQVRQADPDQLLEWSDRIFTATSLDEIFDEPQD